MTDRIIEIATKVYGTDKWSEAQLRRLQRFYELARNEALEDAVKIFEGEPVQMGRAPGRETQHAGTWQIDSTLGRFVIANAAKIRSMKS